MSTTSWLLPTAPTGGYSSGLVDETPSTHCGVWYSKHVTTSCLSTLFLSSLPFEVLWLRWSKHRPCKQQTLGSYGSGRLQQVNSNSKWPGHVTYKYVGSIHLFSIFLQQRIATDVLTVQRSHVVCLISVLLGQTNDEPTQAILLITLPWFCFVFPVFVWQRSCGWRFLRLVLHALLSQSAPDTRAMEAVCPPVRWGNQRIYEMTVD